MSAGLRLLTMPQEKHLSDCIHEIHMLKLFTAAFSLQLGQNKGLPAWFCEHVSPAAPRRPLRTRCTAFNDLMSFVVSLKLRCRDSAPTFLPS